MASNIISRLMSSVNDGPSIYKAMEQEDRKSDNSDVDHLALDEENLGQRFQDQDLDQLLEDAAQSEVTSESTAFLTQNRRDDASPLRKGSKWQREQSQPSQSDDHDDVPESLLLDGERMASQASPMKENAAVLGGMDALPPPVPGPPNRRTRVQWEATKAQQRLHSDETRPRQRFRPNGKAWSAFVTADPKEKAMWRWANVQNLDKFLADVYRYYIGRGIWSILLSRLLNLLTVAFVVALIAFLGLCVNYKEIPEKKTLSDVIIPNCTKNMSGFSSFVLWLTTLTWVFKLFEYIFDIRRLWILRDFYYHLLEIPDYDVQTVSWQVVVAKLMALRDSNPITAQNVSAGNRRFIGHQSKQRMDAHDIANRIMRKDNYLIALFNKDILDLTVPIPFLSGRQFFSKAVEWNISLCVIEYVFNEQGQVKPLFLKDRHRRGLVNGLHMRFKFAAIMSIITAPIMVIYCFALYFLRYFMEFKMNPAQLSSRAFTPLAEWKFREFNELWHLFERRTNMAYPFASRYLDQFPKDKMTQLYKFVAFVAGALASVLFIFTLFDTEDFLGFEITSNRTALFYLGILGTIHVAARGAVPDSNVVHDPEYALQNVIECIHYCPATWKGRLHSDEVRKDFSRLYQLKAMIFVEEMMSLLFTPVILWFSLPRCSARIVDFFREFTIHVDGVGHVCSFAVFDFKKSGENIAQLGDAKAKKTALREDYFSAKDGKMLASYYGFLDTYANNPGRRHHANLASTSNFHPPPMFPDLMSPRSAAIAGNGLAQQGANIHQLNVDNNHDTTGGRLSPVQSVLLDPHHQPMALATRRSPRGMGQSRYNPPRQPQSDQRYLRSQATETHLPKDGLTTSRIIEEDSNLGDSWRTSRAAQLDSDTEDAEGESGADGKGAGVLGLLYQFQKAQTEGRIAGGVNL